MGFLSELDPNEDGSKQLYQLQRATLPPFICINSHF